MTDQYTTSRGSTAVAGAEDRRIAALLVREELAGTAAEVVVTPLAGGRSNPVFLATTSRGEYVVRRPPLAADGSAAHSLAHEVRVLRLLAGGPVPVPRVLGVHDGSDGGVPFFVMDRVVGRTVSSVEDAASMSADERRRLSEEMARLLAAVHAVDAAPLTRRDRPPSRYLERQIATYARRARDLGDPLLLQLLDRLAATVPPSVSTGLVHGDFKVDNMLLAADDRGEVRAVLDWELSTGGDTDADLATTLSFWDEPEGATHPLTRGLTAGEGFLDRGAFVAAYERERGRPVGPLAWHLVLADVRSAVSLASIARRRRADGVVVAEDLASAARQLVLRAADQARSAGVPGVRP